MFCIKYVMELIFGGRHVLVAQVEKDRLKERNIFSSNKWDVSPQGQHVELGIAENNLMLMLAAAGKPDRPQH